MKPTIQLGEAYTPDGQKMILAKHDRDYYISIDYYQLMTSRETESELELARLGCHALQTRQNPHVLIGGLGWALPSGRRSICYRKKARSRCPN